MSKITVIIVISAFLAFCSNGFANELLVPSQYPTIQSAIDAAVDGDTVIVAPGTYTGPGNWDIDFLGKAITVRSENGPENCVIDCQSSGRGFRFHNNEDANSILDGFTITNGSGCTIGGGILCSSSGPTITNCIITGNSVSWLGGGICGCSGPITNCIIAQNYADTWGGGLMECTGPISNCIITGNSVSSWGGGLMECTGPISNCIITDNSASYWGGGLAECTGPISNCTIVNNLGDGGIYKCSSVTNCIIWNNTAERTSITYSDVQGGYEGEGNINTNPRLTPDCRLQASSPCIDAGDPDFLPNLGQVDIDGQPRIMGGRVDMGADEVDAPIIPAIVLSAKEFEFDVNVGGSNPEPQILSIRNILEDTLSWEVAEDCPWLEVYPNTGSSTYEPNYVTLSVNANGLVTGVYDCTFTISSPDVAITPRTVTVTLFVNAELLYVPDDFPTIQDAIVYAANGGTVIVADGTYTGPGNRDIDFLGKAIIVRSVDPTDPLIVAATIIDGYEPTGYPYCGFSFHNNEDANSVLAGFTITNCRGFGAISCSSSPTIKNCIITGNAGRDGGGITCSGYDGSHPAITNCTISNNIGSGIYCGYGSSPVITNCTITGNTGAGRPPSTTGGGIFCYYPSYPKIANCTITGNSAGRWGGGIYCESSLIITSCTITGNSAGSGDGGGIYCSGSLKVTNCTISGNSSRGHGGGIFLAGSSLQIPVTSSIIWGNADSSGTGQSAQIYGGNPNVWFSCIQDDNPNDTNIPFGEDTYNIDDDPCFVDGEYHLLPPSPCIEAGNPSFTYHVGDVDMDGQPRLMGRYVDMGADEVEIAIIVVTKPKGGEVWTGGSTHEINWDSYGITGTVDIFYSINNGADWIKIDNVPDTGSFIWHLPSSQFPRFHHKPPIDSNQCLVLVEPNAPVSNLTCIESGPFTIQPYRSLPPHPWWPGYPHRKFGPKYGCVKWQFQTGGPVTAGVTISFNNRVHIPCEDGKLYTLSPGGKLLWTYDTSSPLVCSPAVDHHGNIYVGAENGKLYAIDRIGRLLWTHTTDGPIYSSPVVLFDNPFPWPYPPWEQPIQIFVCSVDGTLYALGRDGSELWTFETDSLSAVTTGAIFASPAIDRNGVLHIAGIYDPNLYALDSDDDSIKWNCNFSDPCRLDGRRPWPFASPVIAKDGTIYQTLLYDPNLYAINPKDGNIIWSTNLADPCSGWFEPYLPYPSHPEIVRYHVNGSAWSKPALAPDGTIYVNLNDPYLRAVNPNGTIKWVTKLGIIGGFTLTVGSNGLIYAACDDARLYVVDPDGLQVAQFEGFGSLSFPTITIGRTIIVSDANNTVWAISRRNCQGQEWALHRLEDLTGNGTIDYIDLAVLTADWLNCTDSGPPCNYRGDQIDLRGDLNKDLYVDFADLAQLANRWLNKE
jgi:parallel beta-helix repeat protein